MKFAHTQRLPLKEQACKETLHSEPPSPSLVSLTPTVGSPTDRASLIKEGRPSKAQLSLKTFISSAVSDS